MPCCGSAVHDPSEEGIVRNRRCRDVLCLLFFFAFWAGMFVVCGVSFKQGDPNRLVYGTDSWGMSCGSVNTFKNQTFDLTGQPNLYYLDPLAMLSSGGLSYAKRVCVATCPNRNSNTTCDVSEGPCSGNAVFTCPYYRFAERNLYGNITGTSNTSVTYWDTLAAVTVTDGNAPALINAVSSVSSEYAAYISAEGLGSSNTTVSGKYLQLTSTVPGQGPCYANLVNTSAYLHRCVPNIPDSYKTDVVDRAAIGAATAIGSAGLTVYAKSFASRGNQWNRYVGDISKGILLIVIGGLIGGLVLSLVWMLLLRYFAGLICWLTIIIVNLLLVGVTLYCFAKAGYIGHDDVTRKALDSLPDAMSPAQSDKTSWKWIAIGSAVVAGVVLIITLLIISRVRIAIACIKVASQAVGHMPSIMLFPLLPFIFMVGLTVYWVAVTALLYSAGDLTAHCRPTADSDSQNHTFASFASINSSILKPSYYMADFSSEFNFTIGGANTTCYNNVTADARIAACGSDPNCHITYDWNNQLKYAFIYHFFGLLWTFQFIIGFGCVTIAGAIGTFYWSRGDSAQMPTFPVLSAIKNTTVYALGSIAFASIIIAVIQFIRFLLEYLNAKTQELQAANKFAEWAMCCVRCCLWCLQKIVMFINRNAYVLMGCKNMGYCGAAAEAVKLIVTNALRMAVVNMVGDILLFLGKLSVAAGGGLIAFGLSETKYYTDEKKYPDTYLSSAILPIALAVVVAYFVAELFFGVYEMAIDTILLSFCEDCETHGGTPRFAPPLLAETMAAHPLLNAAGTKGAPQGAHVG